MSKKGGKKAPVKVLNNMLVSVLFKTRFALFLNSEKSRFAL
jgi:hypothetical protein